MFNVNYTGKCLNIVIKVRFNESYRSVWDREESAGYKYWVLRQGILANPMPVFIL